MTFNEIFQLIIGPVGSIVCLLFAVMAFQKGWVHTDKEFQDEVKEKLEYRSALFELALPAVQSLSKTTEKAASAFDKLKGG